MNTPNPDFQRIERFAALLSMVEDCAIAWRAVGQAESSQLYDPNLRYTKQSAMDATKALKDAIWALRPDQPT